MTVHVADPWVVPAEAKREYDIDLIAAPEPGTYDAIILAVAHDEFKAMGAQGIHAFGKPLHVVYDLKYILPRANRISGYEGRGAWFHRAKNIPLCEIRYFLALPVKKGYIIIVKIV